ncbi:hypothetical protein APHAL10511_004585 [Amanita phalloides]|nr:hypothetical protein APHAL10511_004585 [Amanita phalloides]
MMDDKAYQLETGQIDCNIQDKAALLTAQFSPFGIVEFQAGAQIHAFGEAPAHYTYHGAIAAHINDSKHWNIMGDGTYYMLNLSTDSSLVSSSSLDKYHLDRALAALALIHLLVEPYPISPFLLYAACFSDATCLTQNPDHLIALVPDKQVQHLISAILAFKTTITLSPAEALRHPVASHALELGLVELDFFHEAREEGLHGLLVMQLLATMLLGHADPWSHQHFLAFSDGFNLKFLGLDQLVKVDQLNKVC